MADEKKTKKIELNDKEIDEAAGGVIIKGKGKSNKTCRICGAEVKNEREVYCEKCKRDMGLDS